MYPSSYALKQCTQWRDIAARAINTLSRAVTVYSSQQKILLNLTQNAFETANSDESTKQKSIKSFAGGYSTKTKAPQKAIKEFVSHFLVHFTTKHCYDYFHLKLKE